MVTEAERAVAERDAHSMARRLYALRKRTPHLDLEDLLQVARIAVWSAEQRYRCGAASFRMFSYETVNSALQHHVRDGSGIPRPVWDQRRAFQRWEETPLSLEQWASGTEDERIRVGDELEDPAANFLPRIEWQDLLASLPPAQATVLYRRFWLGEIQREIAEDCGCSSMWISKLERRALKALRERLMGGGVKVYGT